MNVYYKKKLRIPVLWLFRQAFRGILVYMVLGCAVALGVGSLIGNVYASFLVSGVTFVGIALGGYLFFGMNQEEKRKIMEKIRK